MKTLLAIASIVFSLALFGCSGSVDYTPPQGSKGPSIYHYSFGRMVIDGKEFKYDVSIDTKGEIATWGFDFDTHMVTVRDIEPLVSDDVKVIVIGLGCREQGGISEEAKQYLKSLKAKGVNIISGKTAKAVEAFNSAGKDGLLAFFHLNC